MSDMTIDREYTLPMVTNQIQIRPDEDGYIGFNPKKAGVFDVIEASPEGLGNNIDAQARMRR